MVDKHPIGIILLSNQVKGIRFSVNKSHWAGTRAYSQLPDNVIGEIHAWSGPKVNGVVSVEWISDGTNSTEHLCVLLKADNHFKLLPYANNKSAPKAKGTAAKRNYAAAMKDGPYAPNDGDAADAEGLQQVEVDACGQLVDSCCASLCRPCCMCHLDPCLPAHACAHTRQVHGPNCGPHTQRLSEVCHHRRLTPRCDGDISMWPARVGCRGPDAGNDHDYIIQYLLRCTRFLG